MLTISPHSFLIRRRSGALKALFVPCDLEAPGLAFLLKPSDCEAYKVVNLVDLEHLVLLLRVEG